MTINVFRLKEVRLIDFILILLEMLIRRVLRNLRFYSVSSSVKEIEAKFGLNSKESLKAYLNEGALQFSQGAMDDGKSAFAKALEISKHFYDQNSLDMAKINRFIAENFISKNELSSALEYYLKVHSIVTTLKPPDSAEVLSIMISIGGLYISLQDLKSAESILFPQTQFVLNSDYDYLKVRHLNATGSLNFIKGDFKKCISEVTLAIEFSIKTNSIGPDLLPQLRILAAAYQMDNQPEMVKSIYERIIEILLQDEKANYVSIVEDYGQLAYYFCVKKDFSKSQEYLELGLAAISRGEVEDKPQRMAQFMIKLINHIKSESDDYEFIIERLINFALENFGNKSKITGEAYQMRAALLGKQKNYKQALEDAEKSLECRKGLKDNHYELYYSYSELASIFFGLGLTGRTEEYLLECGEILKKFPSRKLQRHYNYSYAQVLSQSKRLNEAEEHMELFISGVTEDLGGKSVEAGDGYFSLGNILKSNGKLVKAVDTYKKALEIQEQVLGPYHKVTCNTVEALAIAYNSLNNLTDAIKCFTQLLEKKLKLAGNTSYELDKTYASLFKIYFELKDYQNCIEICQKRIELYKYLFGEKHYYTAELYVLLADIYYLLNRVNEVLDLLYKAKPIFQAMKRESSLIEINTKISKITGIKF